MKFTVLSVLLLAATTGWTADETDGDGADAPAGTPAMSETAIERLTEARKAFEDALRHVEQMDFRQVFDNGAMLGVVIRGQEDAGVQVLGVTPDSGAEAAGIQVDDLIVEINGRALSEKKHPARMLRRTMNDVDPGDAVQIVLIRDGEEHDLDVEAMRRPHSAGPFHWRTGDEDFSIFPSAGKHVRMIRDRAAARARGRDGLELVDIGEDLGGYFGVDAGVLVLDVPPGSALRPGDILRRIDDADVGNAHEAYRLLADLKETGEATVRRENRSRTVAVERLKGFRERAYRIMMDRTGGDKDGEKEEEVEIEVEVE